MSGDLIFNVYPCSSSMSLVSLAHGSTRWSLRDMASFPHIKEDLPDWAAAAAHEGGLSNSSCASHGAKQEDVVKKQRVRSEQNPWQKAELLGTERAKSLEKSGTFGCREGKIPEKTALLGAESATSLENNIFGCNESKERAKIPGNNSLFRN